MTALTLIELRYDTIRYDSEV